MAIIGPEEILKLLPHRYPILMVDKVIEMEEKRIVGIKNVTQVEPVFQGHFPGNPIMPGVLQLEAMAQVGGILMNSLPGREGEIAYFLAVDNARFRRIIRPGDVMRIEVEIQRVRLNICQVHGTVTVDGELACEADLKFGGR